MILVRKASFPLALLVGLGLGMVTPAKGDVILSPTSAVGIGNLGNLYDRNANLPGPDQQPDIPGVGFRRRSDGFDSIKHGTVLEGWGVSAGAVAGAVDADLFPIRNIVANGPASFTASSAFISTFLNAGTGNLLRIDQAYSFVADNVLRIATTIANVSSVTQNVQFRRTVDWDLGSPPGAVFNETITVPPLSGAVSGAAFGALEDPSPLAGFISPVPAGGGTFGPADNGAALQLALGTLAPGATAVFDIFHAINLLGQSVASLRTQVQGLAGPTGFVITGVGSTDSAALAVRVGAPPPPTVIAEPPSLALLAVGLFGLLSYGWRRRLGSAPA